MPRSATRSAVGLPEGTYVELVRSVFATLLPTTIMGILFTVVGAWTATRAEDAALSVLVAAGVLLSLARPAIIVLHEPLLATEFPRSAASRAERVLGATYLAFAAVLGVFAARAFLVADGEVRTVVATLVVGYAAGVAAGASLRPWIALPSVLLAVAPTVVVTPLSTETSHRLLGFVMAAFLAGGSSSMVARFRSETEKITLRRTFDDLARHDPLTGLANRLGLSQRHGEAVRARPPCLNALHYLDLDRFKAVNDQHGHPVGDALLQAVAGRLTRLLRADDVAARLGGDEFAILQTGLVHGDEAKLLARRVARTLGEPYSLDGTVVSIGVSIGFVVTSDCDAALEDLFARANEASYDAKRKGGGVLESGGTRASNG